MMFRDHHSPSDPKLPPSLGPISSSVFYSNANVMKINDFKTNKPLKVKRRKTKKELNNAKFNLHTEIFKKKTFPRGVQQKNNMVAKMVSQSGMKGACNSRQVFITENRLTHHQGIFNHEIKSIDIGRIVNRTTKEDLSKTGTDHPRGRTPQSQGQLCLGLIPTPELKNQDVHSSQKEYSTKIPARISEPAQCSQEDNERALYNQQDRERASYNQQVRERASCNQPDHERALCNQSDHERALCNQPDHERALCNQQDHECASCNQPDNERASCNQPDNERASCNQQDHERASCNQQDHERASCKQHDHERASRIQQDHEHASRIQQDHERASRIQQDHERASRIQQDHERASRLASRVQQDHERASRVQHDHERASRIQQDHERASRIQQDHERASRLASRVQQDHERASRIQQDHERASQIQQDHERASQIQQDHERASRVHQDHERASRIQQDHERASQIQQDHERASYNQQDHERASCNKHDHERASRIQQDHERAWFKQQDHDHFSGIQQDVKSTWYNQQNQNPAFCNPLDKEIQKCQSYPQDENQADRGCETTMSPFRNQSTPVLEAAKDIVNMLNKHSFFPGHNLIRETRQAILEKVRRLRDTKPPPPAVPVQRSPAHNQTGNVHMYKDLGFVGKTGADIRKLVQTTQRGRLPIQTPTIRYQPFPSNSPAHTLIKMIRKKRKPALPPASQHKRTVLSGSGCNTRFDAKWSSRLQSRTGEIHQPGA
ncbi:uncharacterized protein LOC143770366 isoform X2 [Ranitomeya variabilis]|uniref:uncharacterized protein LOC143770366 isoform X2 n=1 Tax=Ranitomeya variabilis TaxID=490064 RepID=UPI0040563ABB